MDFFIDRNPDLIILARFLELDLNCTSERSEIASGASRLHFFCSGSFENWHCNGLESGKIDVIPFNVTQKK